MDEGCLLESRYATLVPAATLSLADVIRSLFTASKQQSPFTGKAKSCNRQGISNEHAPGREDPLIHARIKLTHSTLTKRRSTMSFGMICALTFERIAHVMLR